jgi:hypothetical protein
MREIEQLTLWELNDLMSYWKDYPPTHVLVAAYLMGGKRKTTGKIRNFTDGSFNELTQAISFAGGSVRQKLPQLYKA